MNQVHKFRPPDIAPLENVRFRGGHEAGAAFVALRWAGVPGKARPMSGAERTAKRSRSRVPGKAVAVSLRSLQRACAARVRCGEFKGRQGDLQLLLSEVDVAGGGEQLVEERAALLLGPRVMRPQEIEQIALGLVGEHLDDVGQMLALGGELDDGTLAQVPDLNARRNTAPLVHEPAQMLPGGS